MTVTFGRAIINDNKDMLNSFINRGILGSWKVNIGKIKLIMLILR